MIHAAVLAAIWSGVILTSAIFAEKFIGYLGEGRGGQAFVSFIIGILAMIAFWVLHDHVVSPWQ